MSFSVHQVRLLLVKNENEYFCKFYLCRQDINDSQLKNSKIYFRKIFVFYEIIQTDCETQSIKIDF